MYHLASLTKNLGIIVLLQLVEAGKIKLDHPMTKYYIHLGPRWENDPRIQLKHLLTYIAQRNTFNSFRPG
ncbi:serine hydrolase [Hymenobacter sp. BT559]|nr:serine hydrolase [Hymenobacter sp. BT559]